MVEVLVVLVFFMVVGAIVAVESARLLSAVISLGAVGFLLAIAFLLLGAPDVAIVQIGVEVISLVILLRATVGREANTATGRPAFFATIAAVTLLAVVGLFGIHVLAELPAFGSPVMERIADSPSRSYLESGLAGTGAPNIVTAILLDFRAYDTLGEATVLFCAAMGALAVLRRKGRLADAPDEGEATSE